MLFVEASLTGSGFHPDPPGTRRPWTRQMGLSQVKVKLQVSQGTGGYSNFSVWLYGVPEGLREAGNSRVRSVAHSPRLSVSLSLFSQRRKRSCLSMKEKR